MVSSNTKQLSASLEDYLEAILNLAGESKVARCTDIAERLGVAKPSVTGALKLLKEKGLVTYKPYDSVRLTRAGRAAAAEIVCKHDVLRAFFTDVLGIDDDTAAAAACKTEHALGPEIINRLLCFVEFVSRDDGKERNLNEKFERFCRKRLNSRKG